MSQRQCLHLHMFLTKFVLISPQPVFGDIVGFTAWSSVREPAHVFELLEAVYAAFDQIAKKRRVFKVETVGDSYVAVAGLPEPRKDHAVTMARFARECLQVMDSVVRRLEITLGPDTADLTMRFGLHSGAVTAGVLRGERTRFQLFGDTMNTASRMESTGQPRRIQVSQDTAELLRSAGKASWVSPREEMIQIKGKGMMVTYWLSVSANSHDGASTSAESVSEDDHSNSGGDLLSKGRKTHTLSSKPTVVNDTKTGRLIEWNVGVLSGLLRRVINKRALLGGNDMTDSESDSSSSHHHGTALDEVQDVLQFPRAPQSTREKNPDEIPLNATVAEQLHDFVVAVAAMYQDNS